MLHLPIISKCRSPITLENKQYTNLFIVWVCGQLLDRILIVSIFPLSNDMSPPLYTTSYANSNLYTTRICRWDTAGQTGVERYLCVQFFHGYHWHNLWRLWIQLLVNYCKISFKRQLVPSFFQGTLCPTNSSATHPINSGLTGISAIVAAIESFMFGYIGLN